MPPKGGRKKPFSAKQKKEQLKAKRDKHRTTEKDADGNKIRPGKSKFFKYSEDDGLSSDESSASDASRNVKSMNQQPKGSGKRYDPNRYRLHFQKESQHEIEKRKKEAMKPYESLPETSLEIDLDEIYRPGSVLDMPKRPAWDYNMSKSKLEVKEEVYFRDYLENIMEKHSSEELSYFELNLETWRQLWRVIEMADVILLITDIRHPALHFSPVFYDYITKELNKHIILVLNKIDLAPASLVVAWKHYFKEKFPEVDIICFTSFPKNREEMASMASDPGKLLHKKRKKGSYTAVGPKQLLKCCERIVQGKVSLSSWKEKIEEDASSCDVESDPKAAATEEAVDTSFQQHEQFKDGVLTIGCCGYPNVGKSSLINGLVGKKVVSVSRTPGHTKHFQTIFLTPNVKLCDSPGLVFPSLVTKPMQILAGIYPIAQVREPYTTVGYLSQRLSLPTLLRITHPESEVKPGVPSTQDEKVFKWSAYDICGAWAEKRGFVTARASRPDVYRAANNILRMGLEGRIIMCSRPPGYSDTKAAWENHGDTEEITEQQEQHRKSTHFSDSEDDLITTESDWDERENAAGSDGDGESEGDEDENIEGLASRNPFSLLNDDD